jgi:hypothetical protein
MAIDKNLLEEINRFRLYSSYKPGLLLSEQGDDIKFPEPTQSPLDYEEAFGGEKFLKYSPADKELVEKDMRKDLENMLTKKLDDYLNTIEVIIIPKGRGAIVKIGNLRQFELTYDSYTQLRSYNLSKTKSSVRFYDKQNQPYVAIVPGLKFPMDAIGNYDEFILNYPAYKGFFDSNEDKYLENGLSKSEYVRRQINDSKISQFIVCQGSAKFEDNENTSDCTNFELRIGWKTIKFNREERKELKNNIIPIKVGEQTIEATKGKFLDLVNHNSIDGGIPIAQNSERRGRYYAYITGSEEKRNVNLVLNIPPVLVGSDLPVITGVPIPTPTPTPPPIIAPIELKLDLVNAFTFDEVEKGGKSWWMEVNEKDRAGGKLSGKEQFDNFINEYKDLKTQYADVWDKYLEFLRNKKVNIYGYASIDAKPGTLVYGKYHRCKTSELQSVTDYNQCLSEKRAEQAVKDIVAEIPELDGILIPVGGGETDKFDGKSYKNATTSGTYKNRRIYGEFPKFETTP